MFLKVINQGIHWKILHEILLPSNGRVYGLWVGRVETSASVVWENATDKIAMKKITVPSLIFCDDFCNLYWKLKNLFILLTFYYFFNFKKKCTSIF